MSRVVRAEVSGGSINGLELAVDDAAAGAVVAFTGVVRNHDGGRGVHAILYASHPSASDVIAQIAGEGAARAGVLGVAAVHRVGMLAVGDVALAVAVAAGHRAEAFATCAWIVDEIKRRLPVWKKQHFTDGTAEWTGCP